MRPWSDMADWCELPEEILWSISERLDFNSVWRFRATCSFWNSSATKHPRSSPWLMLPSSLNPKPNTDSFFNLSQNNLLNHESQSQSNQHFQYVGSSHGWLILINPINCDVHLSNPIFPETSPIIALPSVLTLPNILEFDDSKAEFRIFSRHEEDEYTISSQELSSFLFTKVVLSSAPFDDDAYFVVAIGELFDVAFCKSGDTVWTPLLSAFHPYIDILYFNNQCYALSDSNIIEAWNLSDSSEPTETLVFEFPPFASITDDELSLRYYCGLVQRYLAQLSGDLLLIVRYSAYYVENGLFFADENIAQGKCVIDFNLIEDSFVVLSVDNDDNSLRADQLPHKTIRVDVYKLQSANQEWIHLPTLGDHAIFMGLNHAMTFSTDHFPELKPNSIYFTEDNAEYFDENFQFLGASDYAFGPNDIGIYHSSICIYSLDDKETLGICIYNLDDRETSPCYPFECQMFQSSSPPIWIVPNLRISECGKNEKEARECEMEISATQLARQAKEEHRVANEQHSPIRGPMDIFRQLVLLFSQICSFSSIW